MIQSATLETPSIRIDESVDIALQQLYVTVTRDGGRGLDLEQLNIALHRGNIHEHIDRFGNDHEHLE